ncbi:polysaccharide deacetylase family protein [Pseudoalteromonas sp. Ps84H-4]|uniref:polysaccharide deacetylase family protein n=1 Tax=Pseudoalteromonas sp. Ps84H-4 TaxID=2954502 RepID=UPI00209774F4|nr:polysaccharide deacetylase family protein [Pseudoalteromonas sp. Ps84H-4]MCO7251751.1 polysaccharide deacetylase family protein [Pseudoalteromonas sp. Ps84H-4]
MQKNDFFTNLTLWLGTVFTNKLGIDLTFIYENNSFTAQNKSHNLRLVFPEIDKAYYTSGHELGCLFYDVTKHTGVSIFEEQNLPVPSSAKTPLSDIKFLGLEVSFPFDFAGLVFWALGRVEEVDNNSRDQHDRFPAASSHAFKYKYLNRPFIDEWFCFLSFLLKNNVNNYNPPHREYELCISHDVDRPMRYAFAPIFQASKSLVADIFKRKKFHALKELILSKILSSSKLYEYDSFNTFDWICQLAYVNGAVNTFYFICGKTSDKDSDYSIKHPAIKSLIKELHSKGHKIGLHPSYNTYLDEAAFSKELSSLKEVLNELDIDSEVIESRMHFLRWRTPETFDILSNLGIYSDSTMGYAEYPGFKAGTCFEYQAVHPNTGKSLDIIIKPLILMEASLLAERYLGIKNENEARIFIDDLKTKCQRVGGQFRVLWHNSELFTSQQRRLYEFLVLGDKK